MNDFLVVLAMFGMFAFGFCLCYILMDYFIMKPFYKQHIEIIKTLETSNIDNLNLIKKNKYLSNNKPKLYVEFKQLSSEEFLKIIGKDKVEDPHFDERKFLIEELTKMEAKGWEPDDDIESLRKLYDLL